MIEFTSTSNLAADSETVWRHSVSPAGVNREFRPLLRMTFPAEVGDIAAAYEPGKRLFRSWLLLLGVFPVEYDDVVIEEVEIGRRFLERSSMLTQRRWEHERTVEPTPQGCRLTDRIRAEPRLPALAPLYSPIFKAVFRWRHRNLRRIFGDPASLPLRANRSGKHRDAEQP